MVHVRSVVTETPRNALSRSHKFKGIRKRSWGRWVSEIRMPHSRDRIWLGSYSTPEQAARAYDVASVCLRGASASLNFPDSPPPIVSGTFSRQDIQSLAAAAADVNTSAALNTRMNEHHTHCSPGSVTDFQVARFTASPRVMSQESNAPTEQNVFVDDIFDVELFREIPLLSNFQETKFLQKRRDSCKSALEEDPYTCRPLF